MKLTRVRIVLALLICALAFGPSLVMGQAANTVTAGVAFNFYCDSNPQYVASYRIDIQGGPSPVTATAPLSANVSGTVTFANLVVPQPGTYQVIVTTIGTNGSQVPSSPFALVVNAPNPSPATNLRLVK